VKWYNWPCGPWPKGKKNKMLGEWALEDFIAGSKSTITLFTRILGWSAEEYQILLAKVHSEYKEQKTHLYLPVCFLWARKPGGPETGSESAN